MRRAPPTPARPAQTLATSSDHEPQRYYRHLLYGPYSVVKAHPTEHEGLRVLLGNPVDKPGDVWEQIASRQDLIASPKIVAALGRLYYDPERHMAKPGPQRKVPARAQVRQRGCPAGLHMGPLGGADKDTLLLMLPPEFEPFPRRRLRLVACGTACGALWLGLRLGVQGECRAPEVQNALRRRPVS